MNGKYLDVWPDWFKAQKQHRNPIKSLDKPVLIVVGSAFKLTLLDEFMSYNSLLYQFRLSNSLKWKLTEMEIFGVAAPIKLQHKISLSYRSLIGGS